MAEHKCFDLCVVNIKPKYALEYLAATEKGKTFVGKHGGKHMNDWLCESGPGMQHICLNSWPTVDTRAESMKCLLGDAEYLAFFKETSRYIASFVVYSCISHPLMPLKELPKDCRLYMEQITYKGSPIAAAQKYKEVNDKWAAMSGGISSALGLLAPTTFDKPCMFGFHASPDGKMNSIMELWESVLQKPEHFPLIDDYYSQISDSAARILMPVPKCGGSCPAAAAPAANSAEAAVAAVKAAVPAVLEEVKAAGQTAIDAVKHALPPMPHLGPTVEAAPAPAPLTAEAPPPAAAPAPPAPAPATPAPAAPAQAAPAPAAPAAAPPAPDAK